MKHWIKLNKITIDQIPYKKSAVYFFGVNTNSKQQSDIVYIGSTSNLVRRIFGNFFGGVGGVTTQRIHKLLFEDKYLAQVSIAWSLTDNHKKLEKKFISDYRLKYGKKPAWNK